MSTICKNYLDLRSLKRRYMLTLLLLSVLLSKTVGAETSSVDNQSLKELDNVISLRADYIADKQQRLSAIKAALQQSDSPAARFDLQREVFRQYIDFQLDSALNYAQQMLQLSESHLSQHATYQAEALLSIARVYTHTGRYNECAKILDHSVFDDTSLPHRLKALYFGVQLALYRGLVEVKHEREAAEEGIKVTLDSLEKYLSPNTIAYAINLSHKYRADRDNTQALKVLLDAYPHAESLDEKSAVTYYISLLYYLTGDKAMAKKFYILSATTDIGAKQKKVYASLMELAVILYEEGDLERAHHYIEVALEDAVYSGSHRFILKIQRILPGIAQAYNAKITHEKEKVTRGFIVIGILLVAMVLLALFVLWQNKKLIKAKIQAVRANDQLLETNGRLDAVGKELHLRNAELQLANSQLVFLNKELLEMNRVKETYLSKFIDLCAEYIDKLDVYRLSLNRLVKNNDISVLAKELKSTKFVEEEFKQFLSNFDETFLKVYPSFVYEFNSLFPEHEKQSLKSDELLNTELRIFALIRLGVTDSGKIAKFLRCSITTVYTYRSKVKNKSICPDEFEDRIMEFSREEVVL